MKEGDWLVKKSHHGPVSETTHSLQHQVLHLHLLVWFSSFLLPAQEDTILILKKNQWLGI